MKLEGRAQKIIKKMQAEGRLVTFPREAVERIQHNVALAYAPKIKEFEQKERASRAYISDIESGRINFYKPNNLYHKITNYFSQSFK